MVHVSNSAGSVSLESVLQITPEECAILKKDKRLLSLLKDLHVEHAIAANKDGSTVSRLGMTVDCSEEIELQVASLKDKHATVLRYVNEWLKESKPQSELAKPQPKTTFDKIMEKAVELCNVATENKIHLAVIAHQQTEEGDPEAFISNMSVISTIDLLLLMRMKNENKSE